MLVLRDTIAIAYLITGDQLECVSLRPLIVSSLPDRDQGGVELLVRDLQRSFRQRGIESLLVTNGKTPARINSDHFVLPMLPIETFHGVPTLKCIKEVARSLWNVYSLLMRVRPDIVHVHHIDYALAYWILLRPLFKYKLLATGHGPEVNALLRDVTKSLPTKLFPVLIAMADRRTGVSPETAAALATVSKTEVITVNNGVDTDFWSKVAGRPRLWHRLVSVGRLSRSKGHDVLLRALTLVAQGDLHLECTIIGEGPERTSLGKLALELGLQRFVSFPGLMGRDAIRDYLGSASIFVLASCDEGLPLALLEGMAAGLAIVATNVGGIPSLITHGQEGLLVEPNDPQALAAAIRVLLESPKLNEGMRAKAIQRASNYPFRKTVDRYLEIYREMAK